MAEPTEPDPPVLSRQHAAGAPSARGLLFTVLGEYVLPSGQPAWTATFLDALGRLGVEEKAARQALMRTAGDGWLASERVGRRTRWQLTDDAVTLLTDGTARIFSFTSTQDEWDGRWVTVHARVPERDRATRHLLRTRLAWAGFGSPSPALWVSTHTERRAAAEQVLAETGLLGEALVFEGTLTAGQGPAELVAAAWDIASIEAAYRQFIADFSGRTAADPLARCTELVHAWRRFPWVDPALPPQFLPRDWHGRTAGALFAERHSRWADAARAEWGRLDSA